MSHSGRLWSKMLVLALSLAAVLVPPPAAAQANHLLLSEVVVLSRPNVPSLGSKFVEITNPTASDIALAGYYLTDATAAGVAYYRIVTGQGAGGGNGGDWHATFPAGARIAAGDTIAIAITGSDAYEASYGRPPDYELYEDDVDAYDTVPDLVEAFPGSINAGLGGGTNVPDLNPEGETVVLYYWDGQSDLVQDVDYLIWGSFTSVRVSKTGVEIDGPDDGTETSAYKPDTAVGSQVPVSTTAHPYGGSYRRISASEGSEPDSGGNGITGHNETGEPLSSTWTVASDQQPPAPPASGPPVFGHVVLMPASPHAGEPVTVSAIVTAPGGVASVDLLYRIDGGSYETVSCTAAGNLYSGEIPAQSEGALVEYYLSAEATGGETTTYPVAAPGTPASYIVTAAPAGPPVFSQVALTPASPHTGGPVTVSAMVTAPAGIASVDLLYRIDGGSYTTVSCTADGDLYSGEIPAQSEGALVEYYLAAEATGGETATYPATAPETPASYTVAAAPAGAVALLLSEVCVASLDESTNREFVEIYNPTSIAVDLTDYYLTDAVYFPGNQFYWKIVLPNPNRDAIGGGDHSDFFARFPEGASIPPGGVITVSVAGSGAFESVYGRLPDYELFEEGAADTVPDMLPVFPGSIHGVTAPDFDDRSESLVLFYWDGNSDLVTDIDIFLWSPTYPWPTAYSSFSKNGVTIDGIDPGTEPSSYEPETPVEEQQPIKQVLGAGSSYQRAKTDEGNEVDSGSNGVGGQDELSEDFPSTWGVGLATPGEYVEPPKFEGKLILDVPARTFIPKAGEKFPVKFVAPSPTEAQTSLRIFDMEGRLVLALYDSRFDAETTQLTWDGRDSDFELVKAGLYIIHLSVVDPHTGDQRTKTAPVVVATQLQ